MCISMVHPTHLFISCLTVDICRYLPHSIFFFIFRRTLELLLRSVFLIVSHLSIYFLQYLTDPLFIRVLIFFLGIKLLPIHVLHISINRLLISQCRRFFKRCTFCPYQFPPFSFVKIFTIRTSVLSDYMRLIVSLFLSVQIIFLSAQSISSFLPKYYSRMFKYFFNLYS